MSYLGSPTTGINPQGNIKSKKESTQEACEIIIKTRPDSSHFSQERKQLMDSDKISSLAMNPSLTYEKQTNVGAKVKDNPSGNLNPASKLQQSRQSQDSESSMSNKPITARHEFSKRLKQMYQFPAEINSAKIHRKAHRNGYRSPLSIYRAGELTDVIRTYMCPCCESFVNTVQIPLSYGVYPKKEYEQDARLKNFGGALFQGKEEYFTVNVFQMQTGDALFFCFVKLIITFLMIRFVLLDAYNLYTNSLGHYCQQQINAGNANICMSVYASIYSTANKNTLEDQFYFQVYDILNLAFIIFSIIFFAYGRIKLFSLYWLLQKWSVSDDDYTVLIEDIPHIPFQRSDTLVRDVNQEYKDFLNKLISSKIRIWLNSFYSYDNSDDIKEYLEKDFYEHVFLKEQDNQSQLFDNIVTSVNLCYDLSELQNLENIRENLVRSFMQQEGNKQAFEKKIFDDQLSDKCSSYYSSDSSDRSEMDEREIKKDKKRGESYIAHIPHQVDIINRHYVKVCSKISEVVPYVRQMQAQNDQKLSYRSQKHALDYFKISRFVGKAFVSLKYQHYKYFLLNQYQKSNDYLKINGNTVRLRFSASQKPNDVYWNNMKISDDFRFKQLRFSYLLVLIGLFISSLIIFGLLYLQSVFQIQSKVKNVFHSMYLMSLPIWTFLVNYALDLGLHMLNKSERHKTKTEQLSSLIVKNVSAKFLNTSVIYALIYFFGENIDLLAENGLVSILFSLVIINAGLNMAMESLQPLLKFNEWKNRKYINPSKQTVNLFQIQLNKMLEQPSFEYAQAYSYYIQMVYICSFYGYLVPLTVPIVIVAFAVQYWIDKYNLLKRFSSPIDMGYFLTDLIWRCFEMSIILCVIGHFVWSYSLYKRYTDVSLICNYSSLILVIIYSCTILFWPKKVQQFLQYFIHENLVYDEPYNTAQEKFDKTFMAENPATSFLESTDIQQQQDESPNMIISVIAKEAVAMEQYSKKFVPENRKFMQFLANYNEDATIKYNESYKGIGEDFTSLFCYC